MQTALVRVAAIRRISCKEPQPPNRCGRTMARRSRGGRGMHTARIHDASSLKLWIRSWDPLFNLRACREQTMGFWTSLEWATIWRTSCYLISLFSFHVQHPYRLFAAVFVFMTMGISSPQIARKVAQYQEDNAPAVIAGSIILIVVATSAVILRLMSRWVRKLQLGGDDYLIIVALVFACQYLRSFPCPIALPYVVR